MAKNRFWKINADLVKRLSLAFVNGHGITNLDWKLGAFENERKVWVFMDQRYSVDKNFLADSCSCDDLDLNKL